MNLTPGQELIVEMTEAAATAWARAMMESWKSYTESQRQVVIALAMAKAIGKVAEGNGDAMSAASEILCG